MSTNVAIIVARGGIMSTNVAIIVASGGIITTNVGIIVAGRGIMIVSRGAANHSNSRLMAILGIPLTHNAI